MGAIYKFNLSKTLRWLHKVVGLAIAAFLILAALTGSVLAFMPELERMSAPHLYNELLSKPKLKFSDYAQAAEQYDARISIRNISYQDRGRVKVGIIPKDNPDTGQPYHLDFDEIFLDPADASLLGTRTFGDISEGWQNLMPFLYLLHYSLLLGDPGWWFMGILAIFWTIDCFNGLLITFPKRGHHKGKTINYWCRWGKAWKIKTKSSFARINFDIHRALSLWLWVILLILAWSSVYMNLWGSFYLHVTQAVTEFHPPWYHLADREPTPKYPTMSWHDAETHAELALKEVVAQEEIKVIAPNALYYVPSFASYRYRVQSDRDLSSQHVRTEIYIDATTGERIFDYMPTGKYTGNTISSWLHTLHRARIWGLPFQIFMTLLGFVVITVSVTGVTIWWKKKYKI